MKKEEFYKEIAELNAKLSDLKTSQSVDPVSDSPEITDNQTTLPVSESGDPELPTGSSNDKNGDQATADQASKPLCLYVDETENIPAGPKKKAK